MKSHNEKSAEAGKKQKSSVLKSIIAESLKRSFLLIKKHIPSIVLLFALQLIFLSTIATVQIFYQAEALEKSKEVIDYVNQLQLDEEAVGESFITQSSIMGSDPELIYRNYRAIKESIKNLLIFSISSFLVIGSLSWAITDNIIRRKTPKKFMVYIAKFVLVSSAYILIVLMLSLSGIKAFFTSLMMESGAYTSSIAPLLLALAAIYFMNISIPLIGIVKLAELPRQTWLIGTRKAHIVSAAYLIIAAISLLLGALIFLTQELSMPLLVIALVLFVFSNVWARLFLILVIEKLKD